MPNPAPDANRPGWPALKAPPLPRANRQIQRAEPGPAQGQQAAWGYRALLRSADAENLGATGRTEALGGRLAVLHGDTLGILDFLFGPALDAIGFHQSITSLLRVDILYSAGVSMSICGMQILCNRDSRHKLLPPTPAERPPMDSTTDFDRIWPEFGSTGTGAAPGSKLGPSSLPASQSCRLSRVRRNSSLTCFISWVSACSAASIEVDWHC